MKNPGKAKGHDCSRGLSENALPGRHRKNSPLSRSTQWPPLPPLRSFADELTWFIDLVTEADRSRYYSRHKTLDGNRWIGAERTARAALREGRSPSWIVPLLHAAGTLTASPPWYFNRDVAGFIVTAEANKYRQARGALN